VNPIPEKHTSDNALPSLESDNQAKTPVKDTKEPEIVVNPLIAGLSVDQEPNASQNENKPTCPNCGSSNVKRDGNRRSKKDKEIIARRFKCSDCSKQFSIQI
jgi:predicted RNA-binding Zn-ribbon protein involved in translation (DUF1610 family)